MPRSSGVELGKPVILVIMAAAGGGALARALPSRTGTSSPAINFTASGAAAYASAGPAAPMAGAPAEGTAIGSPPHREYPSRRVFDSSRTAPYRKSNSVARFDGASLYANRSLPSEPNAAAEAVVYVVGEVARPGVYRLPAAGRTSDAVRTAGGALRDADLIAVDLAAPLTDGAEIFIPAKGSAAAEAADASAASSGSPSNPAPARRRRRRSSRRKTSYAGASGYAGAEAASSVELNAAGTAELESLPGIGPALAARIVEYRTLNGPYQSLDELMDVSGMTESKLDALSPFLRLP